MVEYITGIQGAGKTRVMAQAAAITAEQSKGNVIYVDNSDKLSLTLPTNIRLINTCDYNIDSAVMLYGFLVGLCADDYDLTDVFVDSTMDIILKSNTDINDFMEIVKKVSDVTDVNFHFAICDRQEKALAYQNVE